MFFETFFECSRLKGASGVKKKFQKTLIFSLWVLYVYNKCKQFFPYLLHCYLYFSYLFTFIFFSRFVHRDLAARNCLLTSTNPQTRKVKKYLLYETTYNLFGTHLSTTKFRWEKIGLVIFFDLPCFMKDHTHITNHVCKKSFLGR